MNFPWIDSSVKYPYMYPLYGIIRFDVPRFIWPAPPPPNCHFGPNVFAFIHTLVIRFCFGYFYDLIRFISLQTGQDCGDKSSVSVITNSNVLSSRLTRAQLGLFQFTLGFPVLRHLLLLSCQSAVFSFGPVSVYYWPVWLGLLLHSHNADSWPLIY